MLSLYRSTDRLDEARAMVESLLAQYPEDRDFKRYELVLMDDKDEQARDDLILKFLEEEKDDLTRFVALASFFHERGDEENTRTYLDLAEALQPESPGIIERQSIARIAVGSFGASFRTALIFSSASP